MIRNGRLGFNGRLFVVIVVVIIRTVLTCRVIIFWRLLAFERYAHYLRVIHKFDKLFGAELGLNNEGLFLLRNSQIEKALMIRFSAKDQSFS